jgi:hypothetical protein
VNGHVSAWSKGSNKKQTAKAGFSPLSGRKAHHRRKERMRLRTVVGVVELRVWHGKDPQDKHWGCPVREQWGLQKHQQMSAALEERLAFTATATATYREAALVATKWGSAVDDSVMHALVQRLGSKAEVQTQERLKKPPQESHPQRRASELAILMVDGWQVRFRGPGWGKQRTQKERVEWHEMKTGVFYLHEQAGRTEGGRGIIMDKTVVRWQGPPMEFGERLHWEALRGGLARAKETLMLADGGSWIWHLKADRWPQARELLDFYHGGEHLWALGRAVQRADEAKAKAWVEPRLHRLRHGQERSVLSEIASLQACGVEAGEAARKEKNYFAGQAGRMNYQAIANRGWPIGSGAVESACRQSQCRFKRPGQFWTQVGLRHLCALEGARRNNHWDQLWVEN